MPAAINHSRGFSLPEVLLAMVLMVSVITALGGYHRALAVSLRQMEQHRQLWRYAWVQTLHQPGAMPTGWRSQRTQTTVNRCTRITAIITSPMSKQGQMRRTLCPVSR